MTQLYLHLYLFLYFAIAQADTVNFLLSRLHGRPVAQWPLAYAFLLTLVLALVRHLLGRCFHSSGQRAVWSWTAIGFVAVSLVSLPFASWPHYLLLGLTALAFGFGFRSWQLRTGRLSSPRPTRWQRFMPPAVFALLFSLYLGLGAAARDTDHYEMRSAQTLQAGKSIIPSRIEKSSLATSPRLFAMRAYSLSGAAPFGLGSRLFRQPVPLGGSELLLLPVDSRQRLLFPADSLYFRLGGRPHPGESALSYFRRMADDEQLRLGSLTSRQPLPALDYYLSALLLEGNLDTFVREYLRLYPRPLRRRKLPTYYAEALILYTHTRTRPVHIFRDSAVEANWRDYSAMKSAHTDPAVRRNLLRRSYGQTYWWWYEYVREGA